MLKAFFSIEKHALKNLHYFFVSSKIQQITKKKNRDLMDEMEKIARLVYWEI